MSNRDISEILKYHEDTKHSETNISKNSLMGLDWENKPIPLKLYQDLEPIPLMQERSDSGIPALDAIARAPTAANRETQEIQVVDLAVLSHLLQFSAGITKIRKDPNGGKRYFRAYGNTGALHHIDLYLITEELSDLPAGV